MVGPKRRVWYRELVGKRFTLPMIVRGHALVDRMYDASVEIADVVAVVRRGQLVIRKCQPPDKLVFIGPWKTDRHLEVITWFRDTHVKVGTVTPRR